MTTQPNNPNVTPTAPVTPSGPLITSVANNNNNGTKLSVEASYQALVAGMLASYGPTATFTIRGVTYSRDQLVQRFQQRIAAAEQTKSSKNAWHADVQSERQVDIDVRLFREGMRSHLEATLGKDSANLRDYGFSPRKPRTKTVKVKAQALAKAAATRAARQTMGKKQRKAIKAPPAPQPTAAPPNAAPPPAAAASANNSASPPVAAPPATGAHPTNGGA
jgi:hypothetical protein